MTGPRFYCPAPLEAGTTVDLPEQAAHHALRVLRLRLGDRLTLFNGLGGEYAARIVRADRARTRVEVIAWLPVERESPLAVTLVQALQTGEKMDLTVQKAVELGVQRIVPVTSRRSVRRLDTERAERRLAHWRGIVVATCEQCGRNRLAEVEPPLPVDQWLSCPGPRGALRLMLDPAATVGLGSLAGPASGDPVELLVGGEGGLAPEEARLAEQSGFVPVRLGPRVLRTETAGLAALAAVQFLWGDLKEETKDV